MKKNKDECDIVILDAYADIYPIINRAIHNIKTHRHAEFVVITAAKLMLELHPEIAKEQLCKDMNLTVAEFDGCLAFYQFRDFDHLRLTKADEANGYAKSKRRQSGNI